MAVAAAQSAPRYRMLLLATGVTLAVVIGLAFAGGTLPFGFSPDGRIYVDVARHVLAGDGLLRSWTMWDDPRSAAPMVHYAPGYPLVLAGCSWLAGADPTAVAAPLSAVFLGVVTALSGWLTWVVSRRLLAVIVAMATVLLLKLTWVCHTQALSEPLCLAMLLFAIIQLLRYAERPAWRPYILAALGAAMCAVTRYQGAFLIPAGCVWVARAGRGPTARRIGRAALWGCGSLVPLACWQVRNLLADVDQPVRRVALHWPDQAAWWSLYDTVAGWFCPTALPAGMRLAIVGGAAGLTLALMWHHGRRRWLGLCALVCGLQLLLLLVVRTLLDAGMPLDDRILSPIGLLAALSMVMGACRWTPRPAAMVLSALLVMMVVTNIARTRAVLHPAVRSTSRPRWLDDLDALEGQPVVYSNRAGDIIWHARRPAKYLPEADAAPDIVDTLVERIRADRGVIVYFHATAGREHLVDLDTLIARAELTAVPTLHATLLVPRSAQTSAHRAPGGAQSRLDVSLSGED